MNTEDIARFWAKVDVRGPDECWPWIAGKGAGYGSFWLDGRNVTAHRVAFFLANGKWPDPFGCHSCDNHPCCNPAHIFEGTQWDNDMDRVAKGRCARGYSHGRHTMPHRTARGERHGSRTKPGSQLRGSEAPGAKLTEAKVAEMRRSKGVPQNTLAVRYGVSRGTVRGVLSGRTWRHVLP